MPTRRLHHHDQRYRARHGCMLLAGVDEAGRGALAGPVVVAAVVLGPEARLRGVDDSKLLKPEVRAALVPAICREARAWALAYASAAVIDEINILEATLRAAGQAVAELACPPERLLTDFLKLRTAPCPCEPLVDGDATSLAIAAASVLAKVARDRIMQALDAEYPQYGLAAHKGYGTELHWARLAEFGPSTLHRRTFRGVAPEPFFGTELAAVPPPVRCASHAALRRPVPAPCWAAVLADAAGCGWECFLPECEWPAADCAGQGLLVAGGSA